MADNSLTGYGIYFSNGTTTIRIPVNPEEFIIEFPSNNERYNVLDIGEIITPREPNLMVITWEGLFPYSVNEPYVLTKGNFREPEFYIETIQSYQTGLEPVRIIINRQNENGSISFDTNEKCLIDSFEIIERGGETGDVYYRISISQYRDYTPQIVDLITAQQNIQTVNINTTNVNNLRSRANIQAIEPTIIYENEIITPDEDSGVIAIVVEQREVPLSEITVGDTVIANGVYYNYSPYGDEDLGKGFLDNVTTTVRRIIQQPKKDQSFNYYINNYGWISRSQLQKVVLE